MVFQTVLQRLECGVGISLPGDSLLAIPVQSESLRMQCCSDPEILTDLQVYLCPALPGVPYAVPETQWGSAMNKACAIFLSPPILQISLDLCYQPLL